MTEIGRTVQRVLKAQKSGTDQDAYWIIQTLADAPEYQIKAEDLIRRWVERRSQASSRVVTWHQQFLNPKSNEEWRQSIRRATATFRTKIGPARTILRPHNLDIETPGPLRKVYKLEKRKSPDDHSADQNSERNKETILHLLYGLEERAILLYQDGLRLYFKRVERQAPQHAILVLRDDPAELTIQRIERELQEASAVVIRASSDLRAKLASVCLASGKPVVEIDAGDRVTLGHHSVAPDRQGAARGMTQAVIDALVRAQRLQSGQDSSHPPTVYLFENGPESEWTRACRSELACQRQIPWRAAMHVRSIETILLDLEERPQIKDVLNDELAGRLLAVHTLREHGLIGHEASSPRPFRPFWDQSRTKPPVFAIITSSCDLAQGVLDVLALSGLQVPQDVLVASLNPGNTRYGAFLTRAETNYSAIGNEVGKILDQPPENPIAVRVGGAVRLRRSTDHWLQKLWRSLPASATIRDVQGKMIAGNPVFEVISGVVVREVCGLRPSSFWGDSKGRFGIDIERCDAMLCERRAPFLTLEWYPFVDRHERRVTIRFPILVDGKVTHLGSLSVVLEKRRGGQINSVPYPPQLEDEAVGLDPDDDLLSLFFEQAPAAFSVRTFDRDQVALYLNSSYRHLMRLNDSNFGPLPPWLREYYNDGRPEAKSLLEPVQYGRVLMSADFNRQDRSYGAVAGWPDEQVRDREVHNFLLPNGLFVIGAEASMGFDCSYLVAARENAGIWSKAKPTGIIGMLDLERNENVPGRFMAGDFRKWADL